MSDDGGAREGRPRKRKSRWDADDGAADETREIAAMGDGSRFGTGPSMVEQDAGDGPVALPDAAAIHAHLASRGVVSASAMTTLRTDDPEVTRKFAKYQDVSQRLAMRDFTDDRPESDRSPSPPPKYNRFGVKVNTREARMKDKILRERDELIEFLMERARGEFQPPPDWRPRKKERKLYVPEDEYPGYNFIGLILGPRGNTQKRMERETNTRIMLRGKGSVKPGAHRDHKTDYKEDEPLHVVVLGERWEDVDRAAEMVGHILRPIDEEENVHKRMQLRELASINGTFVETFGACKFCGVQGHVQANCPEREKMESYRAPVELVTCKICGNGGHPTRDCPLAGKADEVAATNEMNQEYSAFLNEIGVSKDDLRQPGDASNAGPSVGGASMPLRSNVPGGRGQYNNLRPGDWVCEPCGYPNYASRQMCKRCSEPRPGGPPPLSGGYQNRVPFQQPITHAPITHAPIGAGGTMMRQAPPPPPPMMMPMGAPQTYISVPPPPPEDVTAGVPPPPPEDGTAGVPPPAVMQVAPPPVVQVAPPPVVQVPPPPVMNVPPPPPDEPEEGELGDVPPPPPPDSKEKEFESFMNNL